MTDGSLAFHLKCRVLVGSNVLNYDTQDVWRVGAEDGNHCSEHNVQTFKTLQVSDPMIINIPSLLFNTLQNVHVKQH